jgi:hypothetical protein
MHEEEIRPSTHTVLWCWLSLGTICFASTIVRTSWLNQKIWQTNLTVVIKSKNRWINHLTKVLLFSGWAKWGGFHYLYRKPTQECLIQTLFYTGKSESGLWNPKIKTPNLLESRIILSGWNQNVWLESHCLFGYKCILRQEENYLFRLYFYFQQNCLAELFIN